MSPSSLLTCKDIQRAKMNGEEYVYRAVYATQNSQALWDLVGKLYPKAVDPATAVAALPSIDWEAVAKAAQESLLGTHRRCRLRTAEECRLRWIHYEMVGASDEEEWTKEEDWAIIQEAESRGSREWVKIAEAVNAAFLEREGGAGHAKRRQGRGRTPVACLRRYQRTLNTTFINRYSWSEEEDRLLRLAVKVCSALNFIWACRGVHLLSGYVRHTC